MSKKLIIVISFITIAAMLLTGCSNATTATVSASHGLSTASKLALGTLKLEVTSQAVTASQAKQLLTLWEGYQSLTNSDTSSSVEMDALVKQIEDSMTSDQVKAIDAMSLTEAAVTELVQSSMPNMNSSSASGTPNASISGSNSGMQSGSPGGAPGGMPPSGGGSDIINTINSGSAAQNTPAATQTTSNGTSTRVNPMLLQVLIQLLTTRSQTTG